MFADGLLYEHSNSLWSVLQAVYPNHEWRPWESSTSTPHGFWDDKRARRRFMDHVMQKLEFKGMSDWYDVNVTRLYDLGGSMNLILFFYFFSCVMTWEP
jgi:hypothetical protein